jgi:hypothetical protein
MKLSAMAENDNFLLQVMFRGQRFILVVKATVTAVALEDRNGHMKFTSMWENPWDLMCVLA